MRLGTAHVLTCDMYVRVLQLKWPEPKDHDQLMHCMLHSVPSNSWIDLEHGD